jgi:hypothetical protein
MLSGKGPSSANEVLPKFGVMLNQVGRTGSGRVPTGPRSVNVTRAKQVVECVIWMSDSFSSVDPALPLRYL